MNLKSSPHVHWCESWRGLRATGVTSQRLYSTSKTATMVGSPDCLGVIPCAISWLFRGISEQKQKTGARFSVRVSALEISSSSATSHQLRDLLTGNKIYYCLTGLDSGKQDILFPILAKEADGGFYDGTSDLGEFNPPVNIWNRWRPGSYDEHQG
uniref:Kinesin motor domain-containing protein n=1 Tax=Timema bartmani TaxID=61472 RepID=A0A7R9ETX8_9NEOP|nr:unnamed protein product [Timema bartmani]